MPSIISGLRMNTASVPVASGDAMVSRLSESRLALKPYRLLTMGGMGWLRAVSQPDAFSPMPSNSTQRGGDSAQPRSEERRVGQGGRGQGMRRAALDRRR